MKHVRNLKTFVIKIFCRCDRVPNQGCVGRCWSWRGVRKSSRNWPNSATAGLSGEQRTSSVCLYVQSVLLSTLHNLQTVFRVFYINCKLIVRAEPLQHINTFHLLCLYHWGRHLSVEDNCAHTFCHIVAKCIVETFQSGSSAAVDCFCSSGLKSFSHVV